MLHQHLDNVSSQAARFHQAPDSSVGTPSEGDTASVQREYLHRPSTIWISGGRGTILGLHNFVHGYSWATCINDRY